MIVVGAGAAGCVVARRSAASGRRTLLVEAGSADGSEAVTGLEALAALDEPGWLWPDVAAEVTGGSEVSYRQGRGLGGGSAVNSLVLSPGDRGDYDRWGEAVRGDGWTWASMAPWIAQVDAVLQPEPASLGPFAEAFRSAAVDAGHADAGGSARIDAAGYLTAQLAVRAGRRNSAADAYGLTTSNQSDEALVVRASSIVDRVVFDGHRAVGVAFGDGSTVAADRVVLSAGALRSPTLLWRSGVRHRALGRTAQDHPSFVFTVALHPEARVPVDLAHPPVTAMVRWSSGDWLSGGRSSGDGDSGDVDPAKEDQGNDLAAHVLDHVGVGADGRRFGAVVVMLGNARSRGRLRLSDPGPGLRFDPGWLAHPADRGRLLAGVRHIAALLTDQQLDGVAETVSIDDRGTPLAVLDRMADVEAERWLVEHPGPVSHIAATLPLDLRATSSSREVDSVGLIGDRGVVRGVAGLHVIDASVLPSLPSGNPQLPVMAVAERLSSELFR